MLLILRFARAVTTALIFICVGLAFLPHSAASGLTSLQKFLTTKIDQIGGAL